jgi:hypothetical protein
MKCKIFTLAALALFMAGCKNETTTNNASETAATTMTETSATSSTTSTDTTGSMSTDTAGTDTAGSMMTGTETSGTEMTGPTGATGMTGNTGGKKSKDGGGEHKHTHHVPWSDDVHRVVEVRLARELRHAPHATNLKQTCDGGSESARPARSDRFAAVLVSGQPRSARAQHALYPP